jgi:hypothetical protein
MPKNGKKVARPTKWGNPFATAEEYHRWLTTDWEPDAWSQPDWHIFELRSSWGLWDIALLRQRKKWILTHVHELHGMIPACFCALEDFCHGDVLNELAAIAINGENTSENLLNGAKL